MNDDWQSYWSKMDNPAHALSSEKDYMNYAEEILFYLKGSDSVIDTGCGSGEILSLISGNFQKLIGLDFSESMIKEAKQNIEKKGGQNVQLMVADMKDITTIVNEKVDCIYNNGVVQYLSVSELSDFCTNAKSLLNDGGKFVFMNVPSEYEKDLFAIEYFQNYKKRSFPSMFRNYQRFRFWAVRQKMLKGKDYDGGLGTWFTREDFNKIAQKCGMSVEFRRSMFFEYGYRFHVIMTMKKVV